MDPKLKIVVSLKGKIYKYPRSRYTEKQNEWSRNKRAVDPLKKREETSLYRIRYPERIRAYKEVDKALKKGVLTREKCRDCENEDTHAHHEDYTKPLEVIWLCGRHHKLEHQKIKSNIISI